MDGLLINYCKAKAIPDALINEILKAVQNPLNHSSSSSSSSAAADDTTPHKKVK